MLAGREIGRQVAPPPHAHTRIKSGLKEYRPGWGSGLHIPQDFSIGATIHVLELNCDFELRLYRVFMSKLHQLKASLNI
jgi:hypothetical protein